MNDELADRIATALERLADTAEKDLEFRQTQAKAAAEEQRAMIERLTAGPGFPGAPVPVGGSRQRRGGS